jgi:hypothetical protein
VSVSRSSQDAIPDRIITENKVYVRFYAGQIPWRLLALSAAKAASM